MGNYEHGVYQSEVATKVASPKKAQSLIQFVIGASSINLAEEPKVNEVIKCDTLADVKKYLGYKKDMKFGINQSAYASFEIKKVAPIICVNVCNPATHKTAITEETLVVANHEAIVSADDVIASSLTVENGATTLTNGTDYSVSFNEDGKLIITLLSTGSAYSATELTVNGDKLDISAITENDVIAGINKIRDIYPKYNINAGVIIAPNFSQKANVASALQTACEKINGCFMAECFTDISSDSAEAIKATTKEQIETAKNSLGLLSPHCYSGWLCGKKNGLIIRWSALAGALAQRQAIDQGDIPYKSLSNKEMGVDAVCKDDGTEMLLDFEDANYINALGISTMINRNGIRNWGNNTVVYPSSTDPKDRWISSRMMFTWKNNKFVNDNLTRLDDPMNKRLVEAIVDSENIEGNGLVANGYCAVCKIEYVEEDNTEEKLIAGKISFRQHFSPYPPAEAIYNVIEYDVDALNSAING